mgnify:CR=1 FL=1
MNNIIEKIENDHFYSDCRTCGKSAVLSFKEKSCNTCFSFCEEHTFIFKIELESLLYNYFKNFSYNNYSYLKLDQSGSSRCIFCKDSKTNAKLTIMDNSFAICNNCLHQLKNEFDEMYNDYLFKSTKKEDNQ